MACVENVEGEQAAPWGNKCIKEDFGEGMVSATDVKGKGSLELKLPLVVSLPPRKGSPPAFAQITEDV